MRFLEDIRKLPGFVVKTRKLQRHSTQEVLAEKQAIIDSLDLCDSYRPLIEANCRGCIGNIRKREKGVDVMMAVDMLDICIIKNECNQCILFSGDADFLPAAEIIKYHNKQVYSTSVPAGYSRELREKLPHWIIDKNIILTKCMK
ncbi:MAG: NYN domain-containing protein [Candidatus Altiarchaeota archaeon]|nr:NYN domain-containing protein [Candidatus Altiarchaeota archaeon]